MSQNTSVTPDKTKIPLRGDIQGLRALAVGVVLLAHAAIPGFEGGFVGVDVFFVISGFLITGLLLGDVERHGKVRFGNFYSRRASRILPAATVVIVTTAIASAAILGILQARSVMTDSLWAVFFAANIHFAAVGTNYFAVQTGTSPLLHYWSLAVEEQFYLVWPAIIALVAYACRAKQTKRVPRVQVGVVLLILSIVSMYLSVVQTANNPTAAYFSTLDRAWELGLGALAAVALPWLTSLHWSFKSVLSWAGIAAIATSIALFNASTPVPGWRTLLPVLGSAAVLVGGIGSPRWGAHHLLSIRPARFVGDISYSLYLWHFPILILGAAYLGRRDTLSVRIALLALAVLLSAVSYHGLENPLRHAKVFMQKSYRALLLWPAAVGLVVTTVALATPASAFAASTTPIANVSVVTAVADAVAAAQANTPVPTDTTPSLLTASTDHVDLGNCDAYNTPSWHVCQYGDAKGLKTVVVIGNSHSSMWVPALSVAAKAANWKFYPIVDEACGYEQFVNLKKLYGAKNHCAVWYDRALSIIKGLHPDVIVVGTYTGSSKWAQGEPIMLNQLKQLTKRIIVLSDTSSIPSPAGCLLSTGVTQSNCLWPITSTRAAYTILTSNIATNTGSQFINVTPWFCDDKLCPSLINNIVPSFDGAHLTPQYSTYLGIAMGTALNLRGSKVIEPLSIPVPVTTP
ncbi:MAG TPA: acyltransferase family protein [Acidimicrobiales bacterium]